MKKLRTAIFALIAANIICVAAAAYFIITIAKFSAAVKKPVYTAETEKPEESDTGDFSDSEFSAVFSSIFVITSENKAVAGSDIFAEALIAAQSYEDSKIYHKATEKVVWESEASMAGNIIEGAPLIGQNPELPRGCEVTSLAMLLNYWGAETDKLTLAEEIAKDETPPSRKDGKIYFGNPNTGFVGDMYSMKNDGLSVYHGPVFDLAKKYFPENSVDITGCGFDGLLQFINKGMPVWVIITTTYAPLPESSFYEWSTPIGDIKVTYSVHSVLITGYDNSFIYFNDPYLINEKAEILDFKAAWEQMGSQGVVIIK